MSENTEVMLRSEINFAINEAQSLVVTNNNDYELAGNARKEIKNTINNIKAYWEPKKDQAFKLHKSLVAAEKDMLSPLEQADKTIDQRMGEYRREIERQRQEAERERRRLEAEALAKAEEARRLAEEAAQKEELDSDDIEILHIAQTESIQAEYVAASAPVAPQAAVMQGISVRKTWKARIVAEYKVPIAVAGVTIRPIDMSALNKLAVLSKGELECPGVEFYQEESTQVRL